MKKLIAKITTKVVDNHGTLYTPTIYKTRYGVSVIFEGDNGVDVGCWGVESLSTGGDTLWLDYGQRWSVSGMQAIHAELKTYIPPATTL